MPINILPRRARFGFETVRGCSDVSHPTLENAGVLHACYALIAHPCYIPNPERVMHISERTW
ncbi:hypothetical protein N185_04425 [Sinorhizobium sp. GW3]|nr:hypothetical protein N185_04425 [Sinorhizobium sp. GW3]KSV74051.1 hypothetical protein N182_03360 [Sinorhizobium sp. GL2]OKP68960.1 hypothetical protein BTE77_28550 [Ensifer adhaerens]OWZ94187.1 hypothetical protein B9J07_06845 [Sinorhizobium sp. LM21]